jgi:hypothetical protein
MNAWHFTAITTLVALLASFCGESRRPHEIQELNAENTVAGRTLVNASSYEALLTLNCFQAAFIDWSL